MSPKTRDTIYIGLALLNTVLMVLAQQNAFAAAPQVAHWVAIGSFVSAALMKKFMEPAVPPMPVALPPANDTGAK